MLPVGRTSVVYDPPGNDLAGEYVLLRNTGGQAAGLAGWTLQDAAGARYSFPTVMLAAGAELRIWTKAGTDGAGNLHWGRTQAVWNNTGDVAALRDAADAEVARFACPQDAPSVLRYGSAARQQRGRAIAHNVQPEPTGYYRRSQPFMHYNHYLAQGQPLGTGVVEGACGHLVKDRMEKAGMRWTVEGAQAVLDLRAVRLNGDREAY